MFFTFTQNVRLCGEQSSHIVLETKTLHLLTWLVLDFQ